MAKDNIEKTVIILEEDEVREALALTWRNDPQEIFRFVTRVIAKKVESALRRRCA
jgi:hypothetical protein